ncbi:MBL fold metallo-hydrolase [Mycobacterium shigaense]|uniref:MBL fold metallo-hydrolase n=1 Tax=Mycobacterium shigaense TaxID=722731 RepID=UPI002ADF7491|nr:MBL fold metallo-hydrolase [Mycobacterium shigaense]MEA1122883.1 MBL fold metallo-hydrolase [Mycobacterium shigaense]
MTAIGSGIQRVITQGIFELDGGSWEVDNNVWVVGDDKEVIVVDAAHDAKAIEAAVGGRHVVAVICTHGHNDHITVAPELGVALDAPVLLNPADGMLWRMTHGGNAFLPIEDGQILTAGGIDLHAITTPGHSPGSTCLYVPDLAAVFSGDTLFQGGPGATGRSFSDFPTILGSIKDKLGRLPADTVVYTGHGDTTTIGGEIVHYDEWVARGN